jgi:hypothetical protein
MTDLVTDNLLQQARDWAKFKLFGSPENNVMYCEAVREAIVSNGHSCELLYSDRRDVVRSLRATVIREEIKRRDDANEAALERDEVDEFLYRFMSTHEVLLQQQLGMEDGPLESKFLTGIFIATSSSKVQVQFLQDVIQADGAHMTFGKYTLFSAYGNTANGTMAPLGFAMLFGNEDTANWVKFWEFIKKVHPIVNQPTKTVITDQDKGSLSSIRSVLPQAGLFHCAFHRRQNIKKKFGGADGTTPHTCLWMYNILVKCSSVSAIRYLKSRYYPHMKPAHIAYLDSLLDSQQFPAFRCHKSEDDLPDVYMYGKTASSGVESMNRANDDVRKRTAVDLLNAAIIMLTKEGLRFVRCQTDAHKANRFSGSALTPLGMSVMDDIFARCDTSIYRIQVTEHPDHMMFTVSKIAATTREYVVEIPREAHEHGSRFGSCTCGFPKKEGIPCDHMVAIVKSGRIPNMSRVTLMPYWYTREQWKLQFPKEFVYRADVTWENIRKSDSIDERMKYCPSWVAPKKKGRPKKEVRKLGIADHVQQAAAKRRRKSKPVAVPDTIVEEVDEDNAEIARYDDNIELEDTKDGVIGSA